MATTKQAVNVDSLKNANETYQKVIYALPFLSLNEMAAALNMNILSVDKVDVITNRRRAGNLMRPYFQGCTDDVKREVMKYEEMRLEIEKVFADLRDNVTNYEDKKILSQAGTVVDNKTKKHPLEYEMIKSILESFGEDACVAVWHAERDTTNATPMGAFNGIYTIIGALKTSGLISADAGNLKTSGAITMPTADASTPYDNLVKWLQSADPMLKKGKVQFTCAQSVITAAKAGYKNKTKAFMDPTYDQFIAALRDASEIPGLEVCTHEALGTGSQLILSKVGLLDIGRQAGGSSNFCHIRNISTDPNEVQFWLQDGFGTRIRDVHRKVFMTNEQTNTAPDLMADYAPTAEVTEQTSENPEA